MSWVKLFHAIDERFGYREFTTFDAQAVIDGMEKYKRLKPSSSELSSRLRTNGYEVVGQTRVRSAYGGFETVKVFRKRKVAAW